MLAVVIFVVSIILTAIVLSIINRNTFGTPKAYVLRAILVFLICVWITSVFFGKILSCFGCI